MIRVTKILGESYDLETGAETKKGLILSNGISEVAVEVSDEAVDRVITLMAEERVFLQQRTAVQAPSPEEEPPKQRRNGRRKAAAPPPTFESAAEPDADPGESYGDASSI